MRKTGVFGLISYETAFFPPFRLPIGCKIQFGEGSSMTLFSLRHPVFEKIEVEVRPRQLRRCESLSSRPRISKTKGFRRMYPKTFFAPNWMLFRLR